MCICKKWALFTFYLKNITENNVLMHINKYNFFKIIFSDIKFSLMSIKSKIHSYNFSNLFTILI